MKLRFKIIVVFILSIIISIVVFFMSIIYLTDNISRGYSPYELKVMVNNIGTEITKIEGNEKRKKFFNQWLAQHPGLELDYINEEGDIYFSSTGKAGNYPLTKVMEDIQNSKLTTGKKIISSTVDSLDKTSAVILLHVPEEKLSPFQLSINRGENTYYTLLIVLIIGILIPLTVSGFFAYLFTFSINRRFNKLYNSITGLNLNQLEYDFLDDSDDELGELSRKFNSMVNRLKSQLSHERELISSISHDLKTPMASIIGYAESLKDDIYGRKEEGIEAAEIIYHKAQYFNKLLEELLELARIQSPTFKLEKEKIDLTEFLRKQVLSFNPRLEKEDFKVNLDLPEKPIFVSVDPPKMERVIANLIDNVIKYAGEGKYQGVNLQEFEEGYVKITVVDKGQGLIEEEEEKVFNNFYRGDKSRNTAKGGLGLGLTIVKKLVDAHQGQVEVVEGESIGLKVIIKIPV